VSDQVSINKSEFDDSVNEIKKGAKRMNKNNSNYKTHINKTNTNSAVAYKNAVDEIKSLFSSYYDMLDSDIGNLNKVRDDVIELDKQLAGKP